MDFRDILRGFFGIKTPKPYTCPTNEIDRFSGRSSQDDTKNDHHNQNPHDESNRFMSDFFSFQQRPDFGVEDQDIRSSMEDMFREVEQSFKEMESLFGLENLEELLLCPPEGCPNLNVVDQEELPTLPPPSEESKERNIRDLVLRDENFKIIRPPKSTEETKVDKDLDEMFNQLRLNLSDMPVITKDAVADDIPIPPSKPSAPEMNIHSSFERVYSTYSFNNGKWEGQTIRENDEGKQITSYHRKENGELNEITEFIPKSTAITDYYSQKQPSFDNQQPSNPLGFFFRLFRPRL